MTTKLDEFSINLPMVSPSAPEAQEFSVNPGYEDEAASVMSAADAPAETSITIGNPAPEVVVQDSSSITVFANSINATSYNEKSDIVSFDIVFAVGVIGEDGSSKSYQVVKRIGIDKCKIAAEAEKTTPMSIVEGKKEVKEQKPVISEAKRFRILAGLE